MNKSILATIVALLIIFNFILVSAEAKKKYPIGACILINGKWCLPPTRVASGKTCQCLTSSGWVSGKQN